MTKQNPDPRYQHYDFTPQTTPPNRKHSKVWPWVLGLVVIVLILVFGAQLLIRAMEPKKTNNAQFSSTSSTTKQLTHKHKQTTKTQVANPSEVSSSKGNRTTSTDNEKFGNPKQFDSVADAKSYAKATQSEWLKSGYTNFKIESDGQGFYELIFVK